MIICLCTLRSYVLGISFFKKLCTLSFSAKTANMSPGQTVVIFPFIGPKQEPMQHLHPQRGSRIRPHADLCHRDDTYPWVFHSYFHQTNLRNFTTYWSSCKIVGSQVGARLILSLWLLLHFKLVSCLIPDHMINAPAKHQKILVHCQELGQRWIRGVLRYFQIFILYLFIYLNAVY